MKNIITFALLLFTSSVIAQDLNVVLKEAANFERSLKEDQALEKYKQALTIDPTSTVALVKASELSAAIGARQPDKKGKIPLYDAAFTYALKAVSAAPDNADANYVMSVAVARLAEIETENKKMVAYVRDIKVYADKALTINPNHAKANYALGKWHSDMVQMSWAKKAAAKALFGGLPDAKIEDAIKYMEKARSLDQYYVVNYFS